MTADPPPSSHDTVRCLPPAASALTFARLRSRLINTQSKIEKFLKNTQKLKRTNCKLFVCQGRNRGRATLPSADRRRRRLRRRQLLRRSVSAASAWATLLKRNEKIHFPRNYSAVISKIKLFLCLSFPFAATASEFCFSRCLLISARGCKKWRNFFRFAFFLRCLALLSFI